MLSQNKQVKTRNHLSISYFKIMKLFELKNYLKNKVFWNFLKISDDESGYIYIFCLSLSFNFRADSWEILWRHTVGGVWTKKNGSLLLTMVDKYAFLRNYGPYLLLENKIKLSKIKLLNNSRSESKISLTVYLLKYPFKMFRRAAGSIFSFLPQTPERIYEASRSKN